MKKDHKTSFFISIFLAVSFLFFSGFTPVTTVTLPLSIDYQLLRSLVIYNAFTDPGRTARVLDENDGCISVVLSEPNFSEERSLVRFETKVHVNVGTPIKDKCFMPIEWDGYVVFFQKPKLDPKTLVISFEAVDSILYDKHHKPAQIAGIVWGLTKTWAYDYLNSITIDLSPSISDLKSFLLPLFPSDSQRQAERMLNSLRPGSIRVTADAMQLSIHADVEELYEIRKERKPLPVSEEELEMIIETWESWDAFLVGAITALSKEPLRESDRQILLDTLLETRYRFITELSDGTLKRDLVREQFVAAWKNISPIFRTYLEDEVSRYTLGYLAFFTASDALAALDKLGPTLGIEISRNGLIRLARLLSKGKPVLLDYGTDVNTDLRQILDFGGPLTTSIPNSDPDEEDPRGTGYHQIEENPIWDRVKRFLTPTVWAKTKLPRIDFGDIKKWIALKDELNPYMRRVKALLKNAASDSLKRHGLSEKYHDLFQLIVFSTAWQESCFQQFKVKNGKITYLRSYNGTSVGLMQINERVWRGIYNLKHLKWNINYNAMAGSEIIDRYLQRYAINKMQNTDIIDNKMQNTDVIDNETLAGVVYAMYNGGPRHFRKFLDRKNKGKYYLSDRLFLEKYHWIKNDQWDYVDTCLVGW